MGTSLVPSPDVQGSPPDSKAAVRHVLEILGPRASEFSDDAIAEAAKRWLAKQAPVSRETLPELAPPEPTLAEKTTHVVSTLAHGVVSQIGDMGNALKFGLLHTAPPEGASFEEAQANAQKIVADMQALSPEAQQSIQNGTANLATFAVAPMLGKVLPIVPGITNKVTQFIVGEVLGGETYGALRPLAEGETRGEAMLQDGAIFGLTGGVLRGTGEFFHGGLAAGAERLFNPLYYIKKAAQDAAQVAQSTAEHVVETSVQSTYDQKVNRALADFGPNSADPDPKKLMAATKVAFEEHKAQQAVGQAHDIARTQTAVDLSVEHTPITSVATPEIAQEAQRLATETAVPLTLEQVTERALAADNPDQLFLQGIADHGHVVPDPVHELAFPPQDGVLSPTLSIWQTMSRLTGEQTSALMNTARLVAERAAAASLSPEAGVVSRRLMRGVVGAGLFGTGTAIEDEQPGTGSALRAVGGMLMAEAAINSPGFRSSFTKEGSFTRRMLESMDASKFLSTPGASESARAIRDMVTLHGSTVDMLQANFEKVFDTPESRNALRYAGEKLDQSAAWQLLNPAQQQSVREISQLLTQFGAVLESRGIIDQARQHYIPHVLKPEFYNTLRANGGGALARGAAKFTKSRRFATFEELEGWLKSEGLDPSTVVEQDGLKTTIAHFRAGFKAMDIQAAQEAFERLGALQKKAEAPGNLTASFVVPTPGMRDVKGVRGLEGYEAPHDVATLLENMASKGVPSGQVGRTYDAVNGVMTKAIIYNPYIHGFNLWRARVFAGIGKDAYRMAIEAAQRGDAGLLHAASYGAMVTARNFETGHLQAALDGLITAAGGPQTITGKALGQVRRFTEWSDQKVFGDMIPATIYATFEHERLKWAQATKFQFSPGSAEYDAAMRRIADYANNVGGRLPTVFRSQAASGAMRRIFLAPQWLETRWNLTKEALNDASPYLSGGVPQGDPLYGRLKMRQLAIGAAAVTGLSFVLSGKPPGFNPNTGRIYARTGLTDRRGREVGIDILGWGQDELRMFAHPWDFLLGKTGALPRVAGGLYTGRDYRGTQLSPVEAVENTFQQLGGIPTGIEALARIGATGQLPTLSEGVRDAAQTLGLGGTSGLPAPQDVQVAVYAAKMLRQSGVPPTQERVWDLQKLMRSALRREQSIYADREVAWYLANEQRSLASKRSLTWLGYHLKKLLPAWNQ